MSWEVLNGLTGLVSAIGAVCSLVYFRTHTYPSSVAEQSILNASKLAAFGLTSSGWSLCCLSFLWIMEPFGRRPTDDEYQQFFGVILAFPAIVIFLFGIGLLQGDKDTENDGKSSN